MLNVPGFLCPESPFSDSCFEPCDLAHAACISLSMLQPFSERHASSKYEKYESASQLEVLQVTNFQISASDNQPRCARSIVGCYRTQPESRHSSWYLINDYCKSLLFIKNNRSSQFMSGSLVSVRESPSTRSRIRNLRVAGVE
jgi:hypothetical protein